MNEGIVRFGSRAVDIGRLRSVGSLAGGLALGAGIALGVVLASLPAPITGLSSLVSRLDAGGRFAAGRIVEANRSELKLALPRPTATGGPTGPAGPTGGSGTTADSSAGEATPVPTRLVRLAPQTHLPRELRPGESVVVVGRPEADGSLSASAVAVRRPSQPLRRAALTTSAGSSPA